MSDNSMYSVAEDQAERVIGLISDGPLEFDTSALTEIIHEVMVESNGPITDHEAEKLAEHARFSDADREQILRELSEEDARDNRDYY